MNHGPKTSMSTMKKMPAEMPIHKDQLLLSMSPHMHLRGKSFRYEAIFPGAVTPNDGKSNAAGLMLNVTNDGWFGETTGPYQHLAQARLRSIEEGLPLARSANTGISALVDPYGRIVDWLPLGSEGVLDSSIPKRIGPTFYSQNPFVGAAAAQIALILLAIASKGRRRQRT